MYHLDSVCLRVETLALEVLNNLKEPFAICCGLMYTIHRRVNGQDLKCVLCISRRQSESGKKWAESEISFYSVLLELMKYIKGGKKN